MSMREDVRWAVNAHIDDKPWPEEKKLAVIYNAPESLMVDQDDWMDSGQVRKWRDVNTAREPLADTRGGISDT